MAIREKVAGKPTIDLTGPEGNAFCILGNAQQLGKELGKNKQEIEAILDDMKSSDYEHLIQVFDNHFGDYVDLVR